MSQDIFDRFYADYLSCRFSFVELKTWYDISDDEFELLLCRCLQHSEA